MSLGCIPEEKLFGVYRGKVLKHLPHGRCKIYIPAAYSEEYADKPDMLPSAEQAVPLFAGSNEGNGVFSYPNIGAIVLCMFYNGDANLPLYFAATLGGENAFGQYSIIKKDLKEENGKQISSFEPVSKRHLVTSGKTHIEWYEKGKLSAIVEDPIRTICSVDYDSWEKGNDNISATDKYMSKLSNNNVWKIRDNKLSNIDCQLVLDNDGDTYGKLSTSTHRYNIIDRKDKKTGVKGNGTLSIDNWNIMSNDGKIKIGTLSTINAKTESSALIAEQKNIVKNIYELLVPGVSNSSVKNSTKTKKQNIADSITSNVELTGYSNFCFDYLNNYTLTGSHHNVSTETTDILTTDTKTKLSNCFLFEDDGAFWLSSNLHTKFLKIGQVPDEEDEENEEETESNGSDDLDNVDYDEYDEYEDEYEEQKKPLKLKDVYVQHDYKLSSILSTRNGNSAFKTICLSTENSDDGTASNEVSNWLSMGKSATLVLNSSREIKYDDSRSLTFNSKSKATLDGFSGSYRRHASWKHNDNNLGIQIWNDYSLDIDNNYDAIIKENFSSDKEENGGQTVDFDFSKGINALRSTFDIIVNDKIAKNEYVHSVNCMNGEVKVTIVSNESGNRCVITFDSQGKMTVYTSDKLDIKTLNSVTITTPTTTINGETIINGETTINNTLHVTSLTTIDADAEIGGKSFLGHIHGNGNAGASTTPPL